MHPNLKPLLPYLIAGLSILTSYFVATEYLLPALSGSRGEETPASPAMEIRTFSPTPVPSTPALEEAGVFLTATAAPAAPEPKPGLTPPPGYADLQNAVRLEGVDLEAAAAIRALPWVRDGIRPENQDAAQLLIHYATLDADLLWALLERTWMHADSPQDVTKILNSLDYIFDLDPDAARRIVSMPFLETLQPHDLMAMESLARLVDADISAFRRIMAHSRIRDGISNEEAQIVALLAGTTRTNFSLVEEVLDASQVAVELRKPRLPLAGEVTLAIIRTREGAFRTMDLLEHAVRSAEDLMGKPFPVRYVALLFDDAVSSSYTGINFGTHAAVLPVYDTVGAGREADAAGGIIAHEVAHYYWKGSEVWLDEGAAEFMATFSERTRTGAPLEPDNYPCGSASGIRELEARDYTRDATGYVCNYAMGERLFLDLYHALGEDAFRQGFRRLNDMVAELESDASETAGMAEVRRAFAGENVPDGNKTATEVIERWYAGHGLGRKYGPDSRPVVAELPEVAGWVNRAYVSLEEAGSPVTSFSASAGGDWAWLYLEYSHDYAGPPTELTFEVVEYFEDGYPYRRNTLIIEADRKYSGGVQWLSIGPGPGQSWAPGRHWIYVHHEGRKVAQVEFEVMP